MSEKIQMQIEPQNKRLENDGAGGGTSFVVDIFAFFSIVIIILTLPISIWQCIKVVTEYERVVIFRLGMLLKGRARGPGLFFIIPCIDTYKVIDLRTIAFDVPPQEILTADSVTVAVDAVVYYKIANPTASVMRVEDVTQSTRLLAATTLRNELGTKNLTQILTDRDDISDRMQKILDKATDDWGVLVERVEIKDVRLPLQMQRVMAAEAEATREAKAKVISSQGEMNAAKAIREAADIIASSPSAIQLKYLNTLTSMSSEKNHTIVFPLPIGLLREMMTKA